MVPGNLSLSAYPTSTENVTALPGDSVNHEDGCMATVILAGLENAG